MFSVPGDLDVDQLKRVVLFVMGGSVVTGLEVGKLAITDRAVGRLKNGAQQISDVGNDLKTVATRMRKIGGVVTKAGR